MISAQLWYVKFSHSFNQSVNQLPFPSLLPSFLNPCHTVRDIPIFLYKWHLSLPRMFENVCQFRHLERNWTDFCRNNNAASQSSKFIQRRTKKYLPTSEDWENYFLHRYLVYFSFPFLLFISYLFVYFLMLIWLLFACLYACLRAKIFIY